MKLEFKNNFLGYFKFYYGVVGYKLWVTFLLCVMISFLDGIGLAMFLPLLQAVSGEPPSSESLSMGHLQFIISGLETVGLSLTLNVVLYFLVFIFVAKGLLKFVQLRYQVEVRDLFIKKVRHLLVDSLQALTYEGFLKLDSGRIRNTLSSEVHRLFQGFTFYLNAAQSSVMLVTYICLAILANYQFAILVAIGAGLSNFIYRRIYISTKSASLQLSKQGNAFNALLTQAINHFKYLKSTNYFSIFSQKIRKVIEETEVLNRKLGLYSAITTSVREPLVVIIVVFVIQLQINLMGASLGSILLSLLLFYRALSFLMVVQNQWQSFIQTIGGMDAISSISREMRDMHEDQADKIFSHINHGISIRAADFSYRDKKVLSNIDIVIPKNKTIALVGESGSGKTTLANLIVGLIKPSKGDVLIDNISLSSYNLDSYRNSVGYISQEPVIFNDHIFNNITFWADPTKENIARFWEIVNLSSLDEFIASQPDKEFTVLGDNGMLISGGQKQRISIARELYKSADVLVLDEATSALDSETELIIKENIDRLHGSYTMVIIAHRLSTIKEADMIFLIEKGSIVATGTFNELVERSERFKKMVGMQEV